MGIRVGNVRVRFTGELKDGFERGFMSPFSRRYLPDVSELAGPSGKADVVVERKASGDFRVVGSCYGDDLDRYTVKSPVPAAYGSEAPVFFLLQAVSRACLKKGDVIVTDSVGVSTQDGETVLFLGYPHTGKSTISALAMASGLTVLSTENTVLRIADDHLRVVGGTDVLVYDPSVEDLYDVHLPYDETTRSGYRILDLSGDVKRREALRKGTTVDRIVILHAAFNCRGASFSRVKGRKTKKVLWQFSTALIKGLDYYEPMPLDMPLTGKVKENLMRFLSTASTVYEGRIIEAFGGHEEILRALIGRQ
ncbi:MAG: hypothetical protein GXO14_03840 [Thermococci archaeon]|nr:hypothetical protein [Thermococci archaeon]